MKHSYIIVDDNHESILITQATAMRFQNLAYMGYATNYDSALNLILEHQPSLIFLEINPLKKESNLSLNLINELYRYLTVIPKIIVTSKDQSLVFRAMEYGVADYLMKPLEIDAFRKAIFKFEKSISQYSVPNPVAQQSVPLKALTFSDFLRQEPIVKEEVLPIVESEDEVVSEDEISENSLVEAADEAITIEKEEDVAEKSPETEEQSKVDAIAEDFVEESIEISDAEPTDEIVESEEEPEESASETDSAENSEAAKILEEIITKEAQESKTTEEQIIEVAAAQETETTSREKTEIVESSVENNNDGAITILPGQKVIIEQEQPLVICVKSYGDYRYIDSRDIIYFEADNNSVDIHLKDGEMVTAFKTLKVFENVLPPSQFLRIHNSYIINVNQVARIHTGNSVCYIKNSTVKLPFSKSYKENVELIIHRIASGNYLEI
ncbi:LytTR family transcriptional regulator DNA-binding domain-containing protein [Flavobacterium sp.]